MMDGSTFDKAFRGNVFFFLASIRLPHQAKSYINVRCSTGSNKIHAFPRAFDARKLTDIVNSHLIAPLYKNSKGWTGWTSGAINDASR